MSRSPLTGSLRRLAAEREREYADLGLAAPGIVAAARRRRAAGLAATVTASAAVIALTWGTVSAALTDAAPDEADPAVSQPPGTTAVPITNPLDFADDPGSVAQWCGRSAPSIAADGEHVSLRPVGQGVSTVTRDPDSPLREFDSDFGYALTLHATAPTHVYSQVQWLVVDDSDAIVAVTPAEFFNLDDRSRDPASPNPIYPLLEPGERHAMETYGPVLGSTCGTHVAELPEGSYRAYPVVTSSASAQIAARGQFAEMVLFSYYDLAMAENPWGQYEPRSWDCIRFRASTRLEHPECGEPSPYDGETGQLVAFVPDEMAATEWTETVIGAPIALELRGEYGGEDPNDAQYLAGRPEGGYAVGDLPPTCGAPYDVKAESAEEWPLQIGASLVEFAIVNSAARSALVVGSPDYDGQFTFLGEWDAWFVARDDSIPEGVGVVGRATAILGADAAVPLVRYDGPSRSTVEFRDHEWCGGEPPGNETLRFAIVEGPGVHVDAATGEVTAGTFRWVIHWGLG